MIITFCTDMYKFNNIAIFISTFSKKSQMFKLTIRLVSNCPQKASFSQTQWYLHDIFFYICSYSHCQLNASFKDFWWLSNIVNEWLITNLYHFNLYQPVRIKTITVNKIYWNTTWGMNKNTYNTLDFHYSLVLSCWDVGLWVRPLRGGMQIWTRPI